MATRFGTFTRAGAAATDRLREYPGYWLLKDNLVLSATQLTELLAGHPGISERQLEALRGEMAVGQ